MMDISKQLNVIFSSDDNYAQHMGAAIKSLLEQNKDFEKIVIFIIDNAIQKENKQKLEFVVGQYSNSEIKWIDFTYWKDKLSLNMEWSISLSSYARLFVESMVPKEVKRILYLDCDMIVNHSLKSLWETDFGGMVLGAVQDTISDDVKRAVGLLPNEPYFNAGMLLINLTAWRQMEIEEKCLSFISMKNGNVIHHDQGTLNGVLKGKWKKLPIQDNLMTIHYIFNGRKIHKYYCDHSRFYEEDEVRQAKKNPVIIHYTPSFTTRPWVQTCKHPYKSLYWEAIKQTPWCDSKPEKDRTKLYIRLFEWRYRALPY